MRRLLGVLSTTAFRWTLAIAAGFTTTALLLFGFIYWQTAVHEQARIDRLVTRAAASIAGAGPRATVARIDAWLAGDTHDERFAGLFAADGSRLAGNLPNVPAGLPEDQPARQAVLRRVDRNGDLPEAARAMAVRLWDGNLLVVGYDMDQLEVVRKIILRALALGLLPTVLLSLLVGIMLASRAQRRIAAVHEAIGRIMVGQLGERLPVRAGGDDFAQLAAAVNGMLGEIERLVAENRAMGSSIAHDLRTPLTRLRTRLERNRHEARTPAAFRDATERAIASVDDALGVVSAVLRISEIEHGRRRAAFGPVDLGELLRAAVELYEPVAEEREVSLTLRVGAAATILGDHDMLLEAVGNLLDNAIKYTPAGTEVRLSVEGDTGAARLRIADHGPGIPPDERERVLRRFYRTEKSRTVQGSGLGLSLVAAVIALHGFRMRIGDGDPGCVVEIDCPTMPSRANLGVSASQYLK